MGISDFKCPECGGPIRESGYKDYKCNKCDIEIDGDIIMRLYKHSEEYYNEVLKQARKYYEENDKEAFRKFVMFQVQYDLLKSIDEKLTLIFAELCKSNQENEVRDGKM